MQSVIAHHKVRSCGHGKLPQIFPDMTLQNMERGAIIEFAPIIRQSAARKFPRRDEVERL